MDTFGTWLGVVLSIAGFALTFWQAWKARTAAEAAQEAADRVRAEFRRSSLRSRLPVLIEQRGRTVAAIPAAAPEDLADLIYEWRLLAEATLPLCVDIPELRAALSQSASAAMTAKERTADTRRAVSMRFFLDSLDLACAIAARAESQLSHLIS